MAGMFREDLRIAANDHHATVLDQYKDEVGKGVNNSTIYYHGLPGRMGHDIPTAYTHEPTANFEVLPLDTVAAIDTIGLDQHVSVLNFASYKNPGGMFLEGSRAQEEALCHASVLYEVLSEFERTYYAQNRKMLNYGMYEDIGIYSRSLLFDKPRKRKVDVMTCTRYSGIRNRSGSTHLRYTIVVHLCSTVCTSTSLMWLFSGRSGAVYSSRILHSLLGRSTKRLTLVTSSV